MREHRRLAAILVADVAGYSKLVGSDEAGTLALLHMLRSNVIEPAIAQHAGRLFKAVGDGFLVEFGSAVQALEAAQAIQQANAAGRLPLRIGIHVGDVVVEGDDLMGDGINVAARIEAIADAGGIALSRQVYDQVRDRVDIAFLDKGEVELKNIVRPVHVFTVATTGAADSVASPALALPDKPSIAVLPFQNMSGDPEQEYFADGIVEDIISALSRFKWLFVIARNSSFTYKGKPIDVRQIGRELGVRYILEGSVRKAGDRVRITGQLIEAASGTHLWSERFEGALQDVFELQDRIATSVVGQLGSQLQLAEMERARRKATKDLTAYDHYLRGMDRLYVWTRESNEEALAFFLKAIELDQDYAMAYGLAALCHSLRKQSRWVVDPARETAEGVRLARRAIALDGDDPWVLGTAGFTLAYVAEELEFGAECIAECLALNGNYAFGWTFSGWVQIYLGNPDTALQHLDQARRLSPRDPGIMQLTTGSALAHYFAGRYEETVRLAEQVIRQVPAFLPALRMAAMGHAMLGEQASASAAAARVLALDPGARVSILVPLLPLRQPEHRERYRDGLSRAGLPK